MKRKRMIKKSTLLFLLALVLVYAAACNQQPDAGETPLNGEEPSVIEPGVSEDDPEEEDPGEEETDVEPVEEFVDLGEATTVEHLITAQQKITSYYFEQHIEYLNGHVFIQVWYKDGKMKLISSVDGYGLTENYYDYNEGTIINYSPSSGTAATMMDFDEHAEDAPDNPVKDDYAAYTLVGSETIDRQYCLILETPEGDLLWVGTKYGFPLQVEFTDSMGEHLISQYKNVSINTVSDEDVEPPADMEIYYYGSSE